MVHLLFIVELVFRSVIAFSFSSSGLGLFPHVSIVHSSLFYFIYFCQILGVAPEKTIKLSVNEAARNAIAAHLGYLPIAGEAVAGGFAGMMQVTVTNPVSK